MYGSTMAYILHAFCKKKVQENKKNPNYQKYTKSPRVYSTSLVVDKHNLLNKQFVLNSWGLTKMNN